MGALTGLVARPKPCIWSAATASSWIVLRGLAPFIALALFPPRDAWAGDVPATDVEVLGVRSTVSGVQGSDKNATLAHVGIAYSHVGFGFEKPFTLRVVNTASLGVGEHAIEGGFVNSIAGGVRASFGPNHGLVLRGGLEGSIFGNRHLWDSLLELPQAHVGYQWLAHDAVVDVAAKTGYVLLGRHHTGDAAVRRLDGSPELGGIASLHLGVMDLRAIYTRVFARRVGAPIDLFEGAFCGVARSLVLCTETRYELGDVRVADGSMRASRVSFVGLTIGLNLPDLKRLTK